MFKKGPQDNSNLSYLEELHTLGLSKEKFMDDLTMVGLYIPVGGLFNLSDRGITRHSVWK